MDGSNEKLFGECIQVNSMQRRSIIISCLMLLVLMSASSATIQTFDTPFGEARLDVPYGYEIKNTDGKSPIQFVKPGFEKPIISVVLDGIVIFGSDLEEYASMHFGEGHAYEKTTTSDNHEMHFYNTMDSGDIRDFNGVINYTEDMGAIVMVFGESETIAYGQVLATFTKEEFFNICKSFAFI